MNSRINERMRLIIIVQIIIGCVLIIVAQAYDVTALSWAGFVIILSAGVLFIREFRRKKP